MERETADKKRKKKRAHPLVLKMTDAVNRAMYHVLYVFARLAVKKYGYTTDVLPKNLGPVLMMSNHTTEADMLMVGLANPGTMYYVCGEHLLRTKIGKLIHFFMHPIVAPRGASHVATVKEILRRIRRGNSVMLFPEGCRSFNGETLPLDNAAGALAKMAGCTLVTYRISGGYFIAPRWANRFRRGHAEGKIMQVYTPEQLKTMSAEQVTDCINRDLYENAYETQRKQMTPYVCKKGGLAEGLENYLIICPHCGKYDTMRTAGDTFTCSACGTGGRYDEYGFLRGDGLQFDSVFDWGKWQTERFARDLQTHGAGELLFREDNVNLYTVDAVKHKTKTVATGTLSLYADRIEIGGRTFAFADMTAFSLLYYGRTLLFTVKDGYFGCTGDTFHAWKAEQLYNLFKNAEVKGAAPEAH